MQKNNNKMALHGRNIRGQQKAIFAKMGSRHDNNNQIARQVQSRRNQPQRLPPNIRNFISDKISILRREGVPQNVAIARAFSEARTKFGENKVPRLSVSSSHIDNRTRQLIITLLGTAIALRILREITRRN